MFQRIGLFSEKPAGTEVLEFGSSSTTDSRSPNPRDARFASPLVPDCTSSITLNCVVPWRFQGGETANVKDLFEETIQFVPEYQCGSLTGGHALRARERHGDDWVRLGFERVVYTKAAPDAINNIAKRSVIPDTVLPRALLQDPAAYTGTDVPAVACGRFAKEFHANGGPT